MGDQSDSEDAVPSVAPVEQASDETVASRAPAETVTSTRTSRAWIRLLPALVVLVVILVFVFQNPKDVKVSLFTFSGRFPLSVALLGAVILGALMTLALGSLRIYQLRRQVRRTNGAVRGRRSLRGATAHRDHDAGE
ncbi:MAG: LapA family protein [Acidimicrobiales bacterium]